MYEQVIDKASGGFLRYKIVLFGNKLKKLLNKCDIVQLDLNSFLASDAPTGSDANGRKLG